MSDNDDDDDDDDVRVDPREAGFWMGYREGHRPGKPPPNPYPLRTLDRSRWHEGFFAGRSLLRRHLTEVGTTLDTLLKQ
jgi:hypothetical protein